MGAFIGVWKVSSKKKILLVEDDYFTRFMMKEIIDTLGVDIDVAENGQDGCDRLTQNPDAYGLVLMDIHMPKLSGVDAARMIRSSPHDPPKNVPIFAVTADVQYHDLSTVAKLGMDGFIVKPVTPGELNALVDRYCTAE